MIKKLFKNINDSKKLIIYLLIVLFVFIGCSELTANSTIEESVVKRSVNKLNGSSLFRVGNINNY
jgi:hypothetical protein